LNYPHASSSVADHVTISIGIATAIPTADLLPDILLRTADDMLYAAKHAGRSTSQSVQLGACADINQFERPSVRNRRECL